MTEAKGPPQVLASLPEGKLLVTGALTGRTGQRATYVIEADRAITLAPTDVTPSADGKYAFYVERPDDFELPPTAFVVVRFDGTEVWRLVPPYSPVNARWASGDNRLLYQKGKAVYIRDIYNGVQLQFAAPDAAGVRSWIAGGEQILLVTKDPPDGTERKLYRMDALTGATSNIVLPAGAIAGPGAQFVTFSPDGRYTGYPSIGSDARGCFYQCNLGLMEIATGRTCLVAQDAPSHQYPQGVGWSPDSRSATYYARYVPGEWSEQHAVDVETCADTVIEPTPIAPTATPVPIPGAGFGAAANVLESPSGRYLLVYSYHRATRRLRSDETPPPEKAFLLTPSPGDAKMYIVDTDTGRITLLVDEHRQLEPSAWLP